MSLFCIRDAGGIRRYKTYLTREQAEAAIEREEGPGCRAPFSVVELTPAVLLSLRPIWRINRGRA